MSIKLNGQTYYRTLEVCKMAGISRATLFRWFNDGTLEDTARKDRRGWRLFTMGEVNRIKGEVGKLTTASSKVFGNTINRKR